jgi:hypothetical protein
MKICRPLLNIYGVGKADGPSHCKPYYVAEIPTTQKFPEFLTYAQSNHSPNVNINKQEFLQFSWVIVALGSVKFPSKSDSFSSKLCVLLFKIRRIEK